MDYREQPVTSTCGVRCSNENSSRIWQALSRFGAPLSDIKADDFTTPGIVVQVGVAPRRIDILTSIDGVDFDSAEQERELAGEAAPVSQRLTAQQAAEPHRSAG
jgi:hypothetical protein